MTDENKIDSARSSKDTRFKKGQSGNPKGRPKQKRVDVLEINNAITRQLLKKNRVVKNGKPMDMTTLDALVTSILTTAVKKGDAKTLKWILEVFEEARLKNPLLPSLF